MKRVIQHYFIENKKDSDYKGNKKKEEIFFNYSEMRIS